MGKTVIRPFNVVDNSELPEVAFDKPPLEGDPVEIEDEMYYVCEINQQEQSGQLAIGLIPLIVRDPTKSKKDRAVFKLLINSTQEGTVQE